MHTLIDLSELRLNRLCKSIPIYIMRFIATIPKCERINYVLLIHPEMATYITKHFTDFKIATFNGKGFKAFFYKINPIYLYSQKKLNKIIRQFKIDAFFIPTDIPLYTLAKFDCTKIVVVHDLKNLKKSCNSVKKCYDMLNLFNVLKTSLETATKIIAISKFTKQDILKYFPQVENKIEVVYNGVPFNLKTQKLNLPDDFIKNGFILNVNEIQPYKNLITLIKAFVKIKDSIKNNLIIVGKQTEYFNNTILPFIKQQNLENRILRLENLTTEELNYLYSKATLFVTPSLNEGFGYTPIEAAMQKCPVISSLQEALPDSTRGLVYYYNVATDSEELSNKIIDVLNNYPTKEYLEQIANSFSEFYSIKNWANRIASIVNKSLPPPHSM